MNEKEFDNRIGEARPPVPEADETEARARARTQSLLRAEMARAKERRRPERRRRRVVLRGALVFAGAAVAVAIALEIGLPGTGGEKVGPPVAEAATLKQAARLAASAPDEPLRPGEYYYVRELVGSGMKAIKSGDGYQNALQEETWVGADLSGRVVADVQQRFGPGELPLLRFQGVELDYEGLRSLPTDPKALLRWLERQTAGDGPEARDVQLGMISELLGRAPSPPRLRAALYRMIDDFEGMKTEGRVRDPLGRAGIGFKRHMDGCELQPEATCDWEIILDPKTGDWLGSRRFLSNGGPIWTATVETGVVDSLVVRPASRLLTE